MLLMAVGVLVFVLKYQRQMFSHELEVKKLEEEKDKEMLTAYISGEEEERKRIAQELHDDVACTMASIKLLLSAAQEDGEEADELIKMSKQLLDESLEQIRGISHRLLPSFLVHIRIEGALNNLLEALNKSGRVKAALQLTNPLPIMPDKVELALFRAIQELINNLLKHAGPTELLITATISDTMQINLRHNGEGIDQVAFEELLYKKNAIGLRNIVSRLKQIEGGIHFIKLPDACYQIELNVPIGQVAAG